MPTPPGQLWLNGAGEVEPQCTDLASGHVVNHRVGHRDSILTDQLGLSDRVRLAHERVAHLAQPAPSTATRRRIRRAQRRDPDTRRLVIRWPCRSWTWHECSGGQRGDEPPEVRANE